MAYSVITKPTVGAEVSKADFGDKVVDNFAYLYALRDIPIFIPLNDDTALTTSRKAYHRIPAKLNGGTLVGVSACCTTGSSSGAVVITVKNGSTSMLSTSITLDETETDTNTAATPPVIDTDHDDVATGDQIEIAVSGAGVGVTYCGVELTFRPA